MFLSENTRIKFGSREVMAVDEGGCGGENRRWGVRCIGKKLMNRVCSMQERRNRIASNKRVVVIG